jgi:hypothetical protein
MRVLSFLYFSLFFYYYLLLLEKHIFFLDYLINTNNIIGAQIHFSFKEAEAEAEGDSFIIIILLVKDINFLN